MEPGETRRKLAEAAREKKAERDAAILEAAERGDSAVHIAEALGVTYGQVRYIVNKDGRWAARMRKASRERRPMSPELQALQHRRTMGGDPGFSQELQSLDSLQAMEELKEENRDQRFEILRLEQKVYELEQQLKLRDEAPPKPGEPSAAEIEKLQAATTEMFRRRQGSNGNGNGNGNGHHSSAPKYARLPDFVPEDLPFDM